MDFWLYELFSDGSLISTDLLHVYTLYVSLLFFSPQCFYLRFCIVHEIEHNFLYCYIVLCATGAEVNAHTREVAESLEAISNTKMGKIGYRKVKEQRV